MKERIPRVQVYIIYGMDADADEQAHVHAPLGNATSRLRSRVQNTPADESEPDNELLDAINGVNDALKNVRRLRAAACVSV